ncbi:MAG: lytic transglycosylase domain-containing protein [Tissierellia bacterium]|nr:lytic transglycosylase domain-containing protein [Tissierellia bacterium]
MRILLVIAIVIGITTLGMIIYLTINYPVSYQGTIDKYSRQFNVDPHLIAAIINVESRYDKDAISHKEARGLMQLSASTGYWGAEVLKIEDFHLDMLFNPDTNIMLGAWYLNILSREFNGNFQLIIAAYNGGSGNVGKWIKDSRYSDDGVSLKYIPFKETREYVERVSRNYDIYTILHRDKFGGISGDRESRYIIVVHYFRKLFKHFIQNRG